MTDVKPLTAQQIYSKEYYQKHKDRIKKNQQKYLLKKNSVKSVCVITPEQINDVIISNQNHIEFIEQQRKCRIENTLMATEDKTDN